MAPPFVLCPFTGRRDLGDKDELIAAQEALLSRGLLSKPVFEQ